MNGKKKPTSLDIIAEHLSVRLIIVQAWQALVGPYSEAVLVCLSITGLRLKYTGLCIVYVPFGTCRSGCHRVMEFEVEDSGE